MFFRPSCANVSPIKEDALAAYGPGLTSKYTLLPRACGGTACTAARISRSMACTTPGAVSTASTCANTRTTRAASAKLRGSSASSVSPRPRMRCAPGAVLDTSTRSGLRATMASICGSSPPPTWGNARTLSGKFEYRSTPTNLAHWPRAHTVSVSEGKRLTMRCGATVKRTVWPLSSRSSQALARLQPMVSTHTKSRRPQFMHAPVQVRSTAPSSPRRCGAKPPGRRSGRRGRAGESRAI